jgi:DNA-binding transcriptional regulator YhcF (GntR family)
MTARSQTRFVPSSRKSLAAEKRKRQFDVWNERLRALLLHELKDSLRMALDRFKSLGLSREDALRVMQEVLNEKARTRRRACR